MKLLLITCFLLNILCVKSQTDIVHEELKYYCKTYKIIMEDSIILANVLKNKDLNIKQNKFNNAFDYNKTIQDILNKSTSYTFFDEQIKVLNKIKALPDTSYIKLKNRYVELLKLVPSYSNKDRFDGALKWCINDTIYYAQLYKNQINDISIPINVSENNKLSMYKPSASCLKEIQANNRKKSYEIALLTYSNYKNYVYRDSLVKNITNKYDSINTTYLLKDGVFINSSIISAAVKAKDKLKLRKSQVDSLIDKGMQLNKLRDSAWNINPMVSYDTKDYENLWLSKILDEDQFSTLLSVKYYNDARKSAENDWVDLEKRGLIKTLEKAETIEELTFYYIKVKASTSMYSYDIDKQAAYSRMVKENKPNALKILLNARKYGTNNNANLEKEIKY